MTLSTHVLRLGLVALLAGCAVQNAASGYGDETKDAAGLGVDGAIPGFDVPAADPDVGEPESDASSLVDGDQGGGAVGDGAIPRADAPTLRDGGVAAADRGGQGPLCASLGDCAACTAASACGWCSLTGRCQDGTATGPVGAACAMGWAWTPGACTAADPCASSASCGACAARAGCGWCGGSSRCVTANTARTGPAAGACGSGWAGTAAACTAPPVDPCGANTDCETCASAAACGWCRGTARCMTGVGAGPTFGACDTWAYLPEQCLALPTDPCRTTSSCSSCVGRGQCGWCRDSDTCHTGSSGGPTDRACRGGRWYWDPLFGICISP
jgi:hypothetical protein